MNKSALCSLTATLLLATAGAIAAPLDEFPRTRGGQPDFSGAWQSLNSAHWNLEPHTAQDGGVPQLGAQFAVAPGQGVVVGGRIPYRDDAIAQRDNY
jgi:hypothetical protein